MKVEAHSRENRRISAQGREPLPFSPNSFDGFGSFGSSNSYGSANSFACNNSPREPLDHYGLMNSGDTECPCEVVPDEVGAVGLDTILDCKEAEEHDEVGREMELEEEEEECNDSLSSPEALSTLNDGPSRLSRDLFLYMNSFLDAPSILALRSTCRENRRLLDDEYAWRLVCERLFIVSRGRLEFPDSPVSYRELYQLWSSTRVNNRALGDRLLSLVKQDLGYTNAGDSFSFGDGLPPKGGSRTDTGPLTGGSPTCVSTPPSGTKATEILFRAIDRFLDGVENATAKGGYRPNNKKPSASKTPSDMTHNSMGVGGRIHVSKAEPINHTGPSDLARSPQLRKEGEEDKGDCLSGNVLLIRAPGVDVGPEKLFHFSKKRAQLHKGTYVVHTDPNDDKSRSAQAKLWQWSRHFRLVGKSQSRLIVSRRKRYVTQSTTDSGPTVVVSEHTESFFTSPWIGSRDEKIVLLDTRGALDKHKWLECVPHSLVLDLS